MRHILSALLENKPGVLSRVSGLISRRGFNIESLAVAPTENPNCSRLTAVVHADPESYEQVTKQLNKLISVYKITDIVDDDEALERELVLVRVSCPADRRNELIDLSGIFHARIVDVGTDSAVLEVTGEEGKINGLLDMLGSFGVLEIVRSGRIAMTRSSRK